MILKKLSRDNRLMSKTTESLLGMIKMDETTTREYTFEQVNDAQDFYNALKLVKDVYIKQGYIDPSADKNPIRMLKHHLSAGSAVFVGKKDGNIGFTVSLFPDSPAGIPMDELYKKELDKLRNKGRRIAEVGCLATHPQHRTGNQNILMHGNRIVLNYAKNDLNIDDLVIIVHPKHVPIYTEVLLFEELTPGVVKNYSKVNHNPAVALTVNLNEVKEKFRYVYDGFPKESDLHHFFFCQKTPGTNTLHEFAHDLYLQPQYRYTDVSN